MTPLMDAAGLRNVTATQLMIENKADVNIRDKWGETVLDQVLESHESAIRSGRRSEAHNLGRVVKLLEKANAK
ncbi:MAG: ankyrin repeat domain-containing protein [Pyrinomonadaceae bacterium]